MYPVSNEILQAALENLYPSDSWEVDDEKVFLLYNKGDGGNRCLLFENGEISKEGLYRNPERANALENLLKPRNDWPGSAKMDYDHITAAKEHADLDLWFMPSLAENGEDYVKACKFYDKAMELHAASQKVINEARKQVKTQVYTNDVEYAHDPEVPRPTLATDAWRDTALSDAEKVSQLNQRGRDMHHAALAAALQEPIYVGPITLGDWSVVEDTAFLTTEGDYILLKASGGSRPLTEQEYRARTAGYAHVQPKETATEYASRIVHKGLMSSISTTLYHTYAHEAPSSVLSGYRIENGWAVRGYAVTEPQKKGALRSYKNPGATHGDVKGWKNGV